MHIGPFVIISLSLIGIGDTLYLSYFQYLNLIPTCAIGGCEQVLTSVYSKFFGVPWSYIGLVYYMYLLFLAILLTVEPNSKALRLGMLAYSGFGFLYSLWAIFYIQITLIGAICQFCAISAAVTTLVFLVSIWHWRASRQLSQLRPTDST
jgi:uncharacterized membrane protein